LSGRFFQRSLFAAVDEILGAIFASRTHRNVTSQPKYWNIINCGSTILIVSLFSLCRLRNTTRLRSSTVDKPKWPVFLQNASGNPICEALFSRHVLNEVYRNVFIALRCYKGFFMPKDSLRASL